MRKQKYLTIFLTFFFFVPSAVFAQVSTSTNATSTKAIILPRGSDAATSTASSLAPQVLGLQAPAVPQIITQIQQAKFLLGKVTLNHALAPVYKNVKNKKTGKITKVISKYNLGDKDIALAVQDPVTGGVLITVGRQNGTTMIFNDPAVDVTLAKFNGVNSRFAVNQPVGGTVIALKYLISNPDTGSKAAIEKGLSPSLYVPYSPNLNSPQVIAYGKQYLDDVINTVAKQLYGLPSNAIPGKTVTEAVPPAMIKALVYAEHSDSSSIFSGHAQDALDQMNILLAVNGPDTYKYSVSNDGYASRGISQFVKSTYESLVQRHPEAFLNPDYVAAMADHVTSVKAMYLLLDDYAGDVRINAPDGFAASRVFEYGAASYNGGTARVAKAVENFGDAWNQDRSGQINALSAQISTYKYQITSLKSQIKKAKDKKAKAGLQAQLASAQTNLSSASGQLAQMQAATLKNGTINYLAKIYKVVQYFNDQQVSFNG